MFLYVYLIWWGVLDLHSLWFWSQYVVSAPVRVGDRSRKMVINGSCIILLAFLFAILIIYVKFAFFFCSCLFLRIFWFADEQYGDNFSVDLTLLSRSRSWEKNPHNGSYIHTEGLEEVPGAGTAIVKILRFVVSYHHYVFDIMDWSNTYRL